jgi:hypothetical protein
MTKQNERLEILDMIQRGSINADDGMKLLEALDQSDRVLEEEYLAAKEEMENSQNDQDYGTDFAHQEDESLEDWRKWWVLPFWTGTGITILSGVLMYRAWSVDGLGPGFFLSSILLLLGVAVLALGWNSRTGPWLHIRIHQKPGETPEHIKISFPLPVRFLAWGLRTFGSMIPGLNESGVDEIILALGENTPLQTPLIVDVDDSDEGEQVRVYIG